MSSAVEVRPKGTRAWLGTGATHIVLVVASVFMVFPFIWQILMSLSTNAQVTSVPQGVQSSFCS